MALVAVCVFLLYNVYFTENLRVSRLCIIHFPLYIPHISYFPPSVSKLFDHTGMYVCIFAYYSHMRCQLDIITSLQKNIAQPSMAYM